MQQYVYNEFSVGKKLELKFTRRFWPISTFVIFHNIKMKFCVALLVISYLYGPSKNKKK